MLQLTVPACSPDRFSDASGFLSLHIHRGARAKGLHPIILAGGPGCGNPESFADYFDLFCVGDGCTLTARVAEAIYRLTSLGKAVTAESIYSVARPIDGLYVPSLYDFSYSGRSDAHRAAC
jgi:hypothetical protein